MKRREFITLLGGVTVSWSTAATAQQRGKVYRIGVLETTSRDLNSRPMDALTTGLRDLGYIEGQNLVIEYRSAEGRPEIFAELASDLVRLNVDLIVTRGTPAAVAAKNATKTIPVVMAAAGDPVHSGLAASLAHPGGTVTGLSGQMTELEAKQLELLKEIAPKVTRFAAVLNMSNQAIALQWTEIELAARTLDRPEG
jgi:putative ABC transport system substrate-binding protein